MRPTNSLTILAIVGSMLFLVGFACNTGSDNTAVTNTATPTNSTPASTTPSAPKSIEGEYNATGTNTNGGSPYKADLIVNTHGDVYQFTWDSNGKSSDGVGVMTDNTVAVAFAQGTTGKGCGVVLYKIGADGSLDGKAGYWGVDSAESEKAIRTSGSDLEGKYDVTGKNTDGKDYKGTLDVKKDGEGYSFAWNTGNSLEGFGVKTGDKVAVGFGGKTMLFCQL